MRCNDFDWRGGIFRAFLIGRIERPSRVGLGAGVMIVPACLPAIYTPWMTQVFLYDSMSDWMGWRFGAFFSLLGHRGASFALLHSDTKYYLFNALPLLFLEL
jgi:hypothetical protein